MKMKHYEFLQKKSIQIAFLEGCSVLFFLKGKAEDLEAELILQTNPHSTLSPSPVNECCITGTLQRESQHLEGLYGQTEYNLS